MSLSDQAIKPSGSLGRFLGKLMNRYHTKQYKKYFHGKMPQENAVILDIGCGGGKLIHYFISENNSFSAFGIDHSEEMISLAQKVNEHYINKGRVEIQQASMPLLPFPDNEFDFITAMETIQFWPETDKSFSEIFRVLKPGGTLHIFNRYPKEGSKWHQMASIKSDKDFQDRLLKAGFDKALIDTESKPGWIMVQSCKPE